MTPKATQHIIRGMRQDTSNSKASKEFAFHNHNIRITAREGHTLLSITNEKMPSDINDTQGNYIGHCVLGDYLVLFIHHTDNVDRIKVAHKDGLDTFTTIYEGNLNFSIDNPIEALGVYENEDIQKVYWVDGRNQPRVINVANWENNNWKDTSFNFIPEISLQDEVEISILEQSSNFAPGVIQYAFTYYNKYGQESNIFNTSQLCYLANQNRGASPEEFIHNQVIKIDILYPDTSFDFLRVYSIHRTSLDAIPTVKIVRNESLKGISYIHNNLIDFTLNKSHTYVLKGRGSYNNKTFDEFLDDYVEYHTIVSFEGKTWYCYDKPIDSELVNYKIEEYDGENLVRIIELDSGVLFLMSYNADHIYRFIGSKNAEGGYLVDADSITYIKSDIPGVSIYDNGSTGEIIDPSVLLYIGGDSVTAGNICSKDNTLFFSNIKLTNNEDRIQDIKNVQISPAYRIEKDNTSIDLYSNNIIKINNQSYYKEGEIYRIGVQFQYKSGKWSYPIFIGDYFNIDDENYHLQYKDGNILLPTFRISLNKKDLNNLDKEGIVRYRAVVVFPNIAERRIVDCGIISPTVFNTEDRDNNNPHSQSSWFFRPIVDCPNGSSYFNTIINSIDKSSIVEFKDGINLLKPYVKGSEIQNNTDYYIDYSTLTYHSPLTEFDNVDISKYNLKARIVGIALVDSAKSNINILAGSSVGEEGGIIDASVGKYNGYTTSYYMYKDVSRYDSDDYYNYIVYPWHRSGSLNFENSTIASNNGKTQRALLNKKRLLNFTVFNKNCSLQRPIDIPLFNIQKYTNSILKVKYGDTTRNYFGEINKPIFVNNAYEIYRYSPDSFTKVDDADSVDQIEMTYKSTPHYVLSLENGYKTPLFKETKRLLCIDKELPQIKKSLEADIFYLDKTTINNTDVTKLKTASVGSLLAIDLSVKVKVKNTYNGDNFYAALDDWEDYKNKEVTVFKITEYVEEDYGERYLAELHIFTYTGSKWKHTSIQQEEESEGVIPDYFGGSYKVELINSLVVHEEDENALENNNMFLYVVELYRDIDENTIFGGNTKNSIANNTWLPASKPYKLNDTIICEYGDTRYQRYDCLKTYAFSPEDKNQIMEVASFMCETRINMLGRYDRNIDTIDNLNIDPTNFNLFNPVYSQKDNFFNYRILDSDMYKLNSFPNTITWSKEKHAGEDVDTWTNITMASTLDLDGNKGEIRKLVVHNNRILAFQEKGIAEVLFNSRVQIPTSDGVPIEITNGYKVEGFRYISDGIGSKNKNSITVTPSGVYFLDSNSNSIYLLTDGLTNLSTEKGFEIWTKKVANDSSFKTFYDNANKDVYFTTSKECLGYSEKLGEFTSFYDYYNSDSMFNIGNSFYRLYYDEVLCLDKMFAGDYTNNYSIEFITNENPYTDKVFSHIEYRADMFNMDNEEEYAPNYSFGNIKVSNEYQSSKEEEGELNFKHYGKSNLKKKFRMWRAEIPRIGKDRMRNPWLKIKLSSRKDIENHRMELHDIIVHYFE